MGQKAFAAGLVLFLATSSYAGGTISSQKGKSKQQKKNDHFDDIVDLNLKVQKAGAVERCVPSSNSYSSSNVAGPSLDLNEANCEFPVDKDKKYQILKATLSQWSERATSLAEDNPKSSAPLQRSPSGMKAVINLLRDHLDTFIDPNHVLPHLNIVCDSDHTIRAMALTDEVDQILFIRYLIASPFNVDNKLKPLIKSAGKQAVKAALKRLIADTSLKKVEVVSTASSQEFYQRLGFKRMSPDSPRFFLDRAQALELLDKL